MKKRSEAVKNRVHSGKKIRKYSQNSPFSKKKCSQNSPISKPKSEVKKVNVKSRIREIENISSHTTHSNHLPLGGEKATTMPSVVHNIAAKGNRERKSIYSKSNQISILNDQIFRNESPGKRKYFLKIIRQKTQFHAKKYQKQT